VPSPASLSGLARVYGDDGALLGVGAAQAGQARPERILHADTPRTPVLPR
jgi:tRNA pseudouridine synthase B-like protein